MSTGGEVRPNKNQRREAAREKSKQIREEQRKRDRRNRFFLQGGIALALVAIATVITFALVSSLRPPGPGPANMASGGVFIGEGMTVATSPARAHDAAVIPNPQDTTGDVANITVYSDYLCPFCGLFETTNAPQIEQWVTDGAATVEYRPIAILNNLSLGSKYSLRAATAAACVVDDAPDSFWEFNNSLFLNQPPENSSGFDNDELIALAKDAGASSSKVATCISEQTFQPFMQTQTESALAGPLPYISADKLPKLTGTPTVLVNGSQYTGALDNPKEFAAFVLQATGQTFTESTSTPAPATPAP